MFNINENTRVAIIMVCSIIAAVGVVAGGTYTIATALPRQAEIREIKTEIRAIETDIAELRQEFRTENEALRQEFRTENEALRQEFRTENEALRQELQDDIAELRQEIREDNTELRRAIEHSHDQIMKALIGHTHLADGSATFQVPPEDRLNPAAGR